MEDIGRELALDQSNVIQILPQPLSHRMAQTTKQVLKRIHSVEGSG
jgi:hypothetical protein